MYLHVLLSTCRMHNMTDKKMWKELRRKLEAQGCEFRQPKRSAHFKVYRNGVLVTVMQQSESGRRSYLNKVTELRGKGLKVK